MRHVGQSYRTYNKTIEILKVSGILSPKAG
jgi:hypothetical protein